MKLQLLKFFVLVLSVLLSKATFSQQLPTTGLLFTAAPATREQRTSLDLTFDSPLVVANKFTLEFDFSIWSRDQFGYIFRIYDKDHHNIDLVYVPESSTVAFLKLVVMGQPTTINIPLDEKDLVRNNWLHLSLTFNLSQGEIECTLGSQGYSDDNVAMTGFGTLHICFGVNRSDNFPTTDVPSMAISNIRILDQKNQVRHSWLLNEAEGKVASDLDGYFTARITNPSWLINQHYYWKKRKEFSLEASSGVACDTARNRLLIIGKRKIISLDIIASEISERETKNQKPSNLKSENYYYSPQSKKIYCIGAIPNPISVYDESNNEWGKVPNDASAAQCVNSTFFPHEMSQSLFSIGGYHNYRYFDNLMRYSLQDQNWSTVALKGDKLIPRSFAAVTETETPGEYLIFGGYGNPSGQQALGPKCLYDLYSLNVNDLVISKKWDMEKVTENFIPMGAAHVREQNPALYVLGFPPFLNGTFLNLFCIPLDNSGYSMVSDTIHFYFDEERSKASLFYFSKTREFYAVIKAPAGRDSTNYKIYSLNYPPVSQKIILSALKTVLPDPGRWSMANYWMVSIISLVLIYLFVLLLKKLRTAEDSPEEENKLIPLNSGKTTKKYRRQDKSQLELPRTNAIYLFGDFRIYDSNGNDISHNFSTKLRHLLLSILLLGTNGKGITNEKLNSLHWTYHSPESAKNNRNVSIKKLRDLLMQVNGIELVHLDGSWLLKFEPEVFCDYYFLLSKMNGNFQQIGRAHI